MVGVGISEKDIPFFISTPFFFDKGESGESKKFGNLHRSNALLITKVKGEGFFLYKKKKVGKRKNTGVEGVRIQGEGI
jgi:hypothetical protein